MIVGNHPRLKDAEEESRADSSGKATNEQSGEIVAEHSKAGNHI